MTFRPLHLLPFRHGRFGTLLHRRDLPRLSPRADRSGRRDGRRAIEGSDIARSLPDRLGRIEALRMGRSSQVALHLSSWKRSYHCRLQAGNVSLEGTCTLLIKRLHRRTGGGLQAAVGRARLDRLTSAWRPNPRHRLNVAHLPSLRTSPIVPPLGTSGTFASPEGEGFPPSPMGILNGMFQFAF